jgi:hypothetical protein
MNRDFLPDFYLIASHSILVLLVAVIHELLDDYPLPAKIGFLLVYVVLTVVLYRWLRRRKLAKAEERWQGDLEQQKEELIKLQRYQYLQSHMLGVIGEFLKDRYKASYELATKITENLDGISIDSLVSFLDEFDSKRREQIKSALSKLSSFLPGDDFKKPRDADSSLKDLLKVSFYAVEYDEEVGEVCLLPRYRFYPNEGEPKTKRFRKTDGAAGDAWSTKRIVVCENGGEDDAFQDMWEGNDQKAQYASMICVPAIEDIATEKMSEVYGILTIDSPVRRGYFQKKLGQFWADLFQPICDLLVYCRESERKKLAIVDAIVAINGASAARTGTASPTPGVATDPGVNE